MQVDESASSSESEITSPTCMSPTASFSTEPTRPSIASRLGPAKVYPMVLPSKLSSLHFDQPPSQPRLCSKQLHSILCCQWLLVEAVHMPWLLHGRVYLWSCETRNTAEPPQASQDGQPLHILGFAEQGQVMEAGAHETP